MESFKCKNGEKVQIELDEFSYQIKVTTMVGEKIGGIDFGLRETDGHGTQVLLMTNCYLDGLKGDYVRKGIGSRCIELANEVFGYPICARDHDGIRREDGSHLTEDAPAFVEEMIKRNLMHRY